ncbi:TetR/AcrR family transcriptional regulator [Paenibacillus apiarius]|uniref:TetR/AcrR family transcriptional regulator n=1 Tax=Paenibacillus apiarius TaxID=46240 RepID=UPI00197E24BE|nr:TetR family transcriptional regulator C-terminal domain-containing protein [Paenibacillus apiarius]MBN3523607.1 TetR family transcriptional regulator C-terminal domain-containing protein [Paenibacillus apiarius]
MPKIVDHEERKEKLAEAAWRVIRRDGLERASVRTIAAEAGISAGSMRHYFSTQSELLAFSMKLVSDRVKARIRSTEFTGVPFEDIQLLLYELLPRDEERSAEMEVWFNFTAKALVDPALQSLSNEVYDELRAAMSQSIDLLVDSGLARPDLNREIESERLYALIDGLAVHAVMQPGRVTSDVLKSVVLHHLEALCQ